MDDFSRAALEISSSTHSNDSIATVLSLEPSVARELSAEAPSLWRWDASPGPHALDELVAALHGRAAELRALREHFATAIVVSHSRGVEVSANTIGELALLGCDIRWEIEPGPAKQRRAPS